MKILLFGRMVLVYILLNFMKMTILTFNLMNIVNIIAFMK